MNPDSDMHARARLTIRGGVQGVGFRPCVYRLACELNLAGWVNNTSQGVTIELEGMRPSVDKFLLRLEAEKPPRSFIQSVETVWLAPLGLVGFEIRESDSTGEIYTIVLPDIATCPECLREILDPSNRRHDYPFTNCTHCGPRFSIMTALPYDRPNTSMRDFAMCADCRREYEDPHDRRFHAQPNACPACGPHLEWWSDGGSILCTHGDALKAAVAAIAEGAIVAVKGLGGFQLVVDANNQNAVLRLRARKHRDEKPFALMLPTLESVRKECVISEMEERLLRSPESPIVLVRRNRNSTSLAPSVASGNPLLGVMLPYTPLHHLLMTKIAFPIVATSGNRSDEPICTEQSDALQQLQGIADFYLVHNRRIVRHVDDSIVRVMMGRESVMRRARGYAPLPVQLKSNFPRTLALGAHLKNTIALSVGDSVFSSQHIGDLDTAASFGAFHKAISDFQFLYGIQPQVIAADSHPDYISTKAAPELINETGSKFITVQHHLAHVLSCMAENEIVPPVLGIAWDGTGYGPDGTIWGGEFLEVFPSGVRRVAHLRTFPLPGGDVAVREPRRCALGLLYEIFGEDAFEMTDLPPLRAFSLAEKSNLRIMLQRKLNAPRTSSMGRIFDAMASLAGIRQFSSFEGQAAMEWEWMAGGGSLENNRVYPICTSAADEAFPQSLDWAPMVRAIISEARAGIPAHELSKIFHGTLVKMIVDVARRIGHPQVVLSGGCFQNEFLLRHVVQHLLNEGYTPVWHQRFPPNDGGISLGQVAAVAMNVSSL